jgi:type IV fimbrial biogenesis protein FimT
MRFDANHRRSPNTSATEKRTEICMFPTIIPAQRDCSEAVLRPQRGFTLIELMVTISVLAILVSLAAPSFREMLLRNRTASISNEFTASIARARSEAINRNTCVTFCRSTLVPSTTTSAAQCDAGTNWTPGWIAFVNATCDATINEPTADTLVLASGPLNSEFTLSSNGTNNDKLMFAGTGQLRAGDAGRFNLQYLNTGSSRTSNRSVCVSRLGRTLLVSYGTTCP